MTTRPAHHCGSLYNCHTVKIMDVQHHLPNVCVQAIPIDDATTLTLSEFHARLRRYAAGFQQHGLWPGDRICVHVGNSVDNFVAMWGCVVAGASIVLAKPSLTERELRYQITDSDSTHLLAEPSLVEKAAKASADLPLKGRFTVGSFAAEGFVSMEPISNIDESTFEEVSVQDPRDCTLAIIYTSGTTGLPKGVELTHHGFLANIVMSRWSFPWDDSDVVLLPTPITHGSGLLSITISILLDTTCVIVPPSQGLSDVAKVIEKRRVTAAVFLPWHLQALVDEMRATGQRLRGLRRVCTGGYPLSQRQYDEMRAAFGEDLQCLANVYAMTEATALLSSPSREHAVGVDMGFPAPATQLKVGECARSTFSGTAASAFNFGVVDMRTGKRLGPNQTGEIRFRAPTVMKGYYKRPKETADFFDEEGWCKSGDAGYYDEDGRIYFVQRFKEMIKCMDNQVVPAELEHILMREHSRDVVDICVVGIANPKYGEAPAAAVVLRNRLSQQELTDLSKRIKATVAENCALHKQLYGGVFFVDTIPKTESGKTNRAAVIKKCAQ
ncbi:uncharacterized protein LOC144115863 isoform X2 [Amblyomma americanum]